MGTKLRQSGLTLTELAVVIAVMALLAGLALPAARVIIGSFESGDSARSMISAALASARALAAAKDSYVGIRFQKAYNPDAPDPLNPLTAPQYMIFIVHDPAMMASGFRVVKGTKPIKLPDSIGVMDLTVFTRTYARDSYVPDIVEKPINDNSLIDQTSEINDTTTFSIIFSPSGKLVIHKVQTRNRNGFPDTKTNTDVSNDDMFNKKVRVDSGLAMFYQDDYCGAWWSSYPDYGLGPEYSRNRFVIYDRDKFSRAFGAGGVASRAWSDYLAALATETIYLNPYTGTIISKD